MPKFNLPTCPNCLKLPSDPLFKNDGIYYSQYAQRKLRRVYIKVNIKLTKNKTKWFPIGWFCQECLYFLPTIEKNESDIYSLVNDFLEKEIS